MNNYNADINFVIKLLTLNPNAIMRIIWYQQFHIIEGILMWSVQSGVLFLKNPLKQGLCLCA